MKERKISRRAVCSAMVASLALGVLEAVAALPLLLLLLPVPEQLLPTSVSLFAS